MQSPDSPRLSPSPHVGMQPNESSVEQAKLSAAQPARPEGELQPPVEEAVLSQITPVSPSLDGLDGLHKRKIAGAKAIPSKVLRQIPIEETDGEQVLYPRQTQPSEQCQRLISEPRGESEKSPSVIKRMRTFVPQPVIGKDIGARRMRRLISGRFPSSDPELYVCSRKEEWGSLEVCDRPASASSIMPLKPLNAILSPQSPPPPPSGPVPILNSGRDVPNHSGTDPGMNMGIKTNLSIPVIPPTRKKPPAVVVADTGSKKAMSALPDLSERITRPNTYASAHGGFADVWTGFWQTETGIRKVAIKVLRSQSDNEQGKKRLNKKLRRELKVWQRLKHENVVPLCGVTSNFGPYTSMVCPWMENGTLNNYLENAGNTLRLTDRFRILREVATGLSYLHSFDVIHGDLTGSNVLISDKGQAMLSDFGLSTIIAEFQGTSYFTSSIRGAVRWAAREIYVINEGDSVLAVSTHSDVYSFGSVMLQTLSNKVPYHYLRNDALVLLQLDKGVYPRRPSETWVTDDLWKFINRCWVKNPINRPTIREVLAFVNFHYYACALT